MQDLEQLIEKKCARQTIRLPFRPRRCRRLGAIRDLIQETHLLASAFIAPLFIIEGENGSVPIASMPEVCRYTIDKALFEISEYVALGIKSVIIFCYTPEEKKDPVGSYAYKKGNLLQQAVFEIKKAFPDLCLFADIALDPFTDHGHDGLVSEEGEILNDETVELLAQMSLRAAEAGVDFVSPSDMMDGRVGYIRKALDDNGFCQVGIMSYAAKYASSLYGPFRDALDSSPQFGDKKGYQLNPANTREAVLECILDEQEGADILLVKPALTNLDIITKVRKATHLPIGAYQVSGEWSMIQAAAQNGWLNKERVLIETLTCIKRAGADFILTYGAKQAAKILKSL